MRRIPDPLREAWQLALRHPDPLIALGAARAVRAHLANWEAELAAEAIDHGATWEMIGDATGTSRQAAWERFRSRGGTARRDDRRATYDAEMRRLRGEVDRLKRRGKGTV